LAKSASSGPLTWKKARSAWLTHRLGRQTPAQPAGVQRCGLDFGTTPLARRTNSMAKAAKSSPGRSVSKSTSFRHSRRNYPQMDLSLQYATDVDLNAEMPPARALFLRGPKGQFVPEDRVVTSRCPCLGSAGPSPISTLMWGLTVLTSLDWTPFLGDNFSAEFSTRTESPVPASGGTFLAQGYCESRKPDPEQPESQSAATPPHRVQRMPSGTTSSRLRQFQLALTPTSRAANHSITVAWI